MKPHKNFNTVLILIFFIFPKIFYSQHEKILPKGLSEKEKSELLVKGFQFKSSATTKAPTGNVRTSAEWEEVEYLVISWNNSYNDILSEIVVASVKECKVVIARGTTAESTIRTKLKSSPYSMTDAEIAAKIIFLTATTDSIWIRDFAGNTIYTDDVGELGLADWRYNRPRNNDDTVPTAHSTELGIPIYVTDMVNTGGNFMSDGMGNAFASELVISENDVAPFYYTFYPAVRRDESAIDAIMSQYMGINSYYKMPTLPYDGIHHIDMHMKLLDEETILVSTYPGNVADGAQIEANIAQLLVDKVSVFGTPYKIERIESPVDDRGRYPNNGGSYCTYSNSTIVNKTILLPNYVNGDNAGAIAKYEELMPGYKVVGIDVETSEDLIQWSGAIHCITHTIGVAKPLLMVHQPVEEVSSGSTFNLTTILKHIDGINEAKVMWRIAGSEAIGSTVFPNQVVMTKDGITDDWTATMPVSASTTDIEYYIVATSNGTVEKTLTRPLTAVKTDPTDTSEPIGFYTVKSNSTLSVDEWAENNISIAYPNPTYNNVSFKLNNIGGTVDISIYNALGQKLFNEKVNSGNGFIELNLNEEWKGQLIVLFEGEFGRVARKIMKL